LGGEGAASYRSLGSSVSYHSGVWDRAPPLKGFVHSGGRNSPEICCGQVREPVAPTLKSAPVFDVYMAENVDAKKNSPSC